MHPMSTIKATSVIASPTWLWDMNTEKILVPRPLGFSGNLYDPCFLIILTLAHLNLGVSK